MIVSTTKMTAQQFLELGDDPPGVRLELVDGEIAVSPSPTPEHSYVVLELAAIIRDHVKRHKLGRVYADVDTIVTMPGTLGVAPTATVATKVAIYETDGALDNAAQVTADTPARVGQ